MRTVTAGRSLAGAIDNSNYVFLSLNPEELDVRITPGEWFLLATPSGTYMAYANPFSAKGLSLRVCAKHTGPADLKTWFHAKLEEARLRRYKTYGNDGHRLVHGGGDFLPGLIVDTYKNMIIVEVNTLGMWNQVENLKEYLRSKYPERIIHIHSHDKYGEQLPTIENEEAVTSIIVEESGFTYHLPWSSKQKLGFYYDHRENRKKLHITIQNLRENGADFKKGLDLFCYQGSWGLFALRAGVEYITFVDQGDFSSLVLDHLERNNLKGRGDFVRKDTFAYLDECIQQSLKFDLVVSDPPAFTKKIDQKNQALRGYDKLHDKCLRVIESGGIFVAASCTSYLTLQDLDRSVVKAAKKQDKKIRLLDIGLQGSDHPALGLDSSENYIKYLCYIID